jgi:hypothetical protein
VQLKNLNKALTMLGGQSIPYLLQEQRPYQPLQNSKYSVSSAGKVVSKDNYQVKFSWKVLSKDSNGMCM